MFSALILFVALSADRPDLAFLAESVSQADRLVITYIEPRPPIAIEVKDRQLFKNLAVALKGTESSVALDAAPVLGTRDILVCEVLKGKNRSCVFSLSCATTLYFELNGWHKIELNSKRVHAVLFPLFKDKLPPAPVEEPLPSATTIDAPKLTPKAVPKSKP